MCGIAGYVAKEGVVGTEVLMRMANAMKHRGPDAQTYFCEANVGLAHARLSIIDLNTGGQPMLSNDGSLAVVLNGEIYNFKQLRKDLEAEGYVFRTTSDTEVLLYAYAAAPDIEAFLSRLGGMFAFALYDKPRQRLLLVRDRLGKKPLYLYEDAYCLAFASEPKALRTIPNFLLDISEEGLQCYLELGYIPAPWSIYKSVRKVEPGAYVLIDTKDTNVIEHRQWWDVAQHAWLQGDRSPNDDFFQELQCLIRERVHERLVADVPIGAFLSGGLDSSLVVQHAASFVPSLKTFHFCFPGTTFDESVYAARVAEQFLTQHTTLNLERSAYDTAVRRASWVFDEPFNDFSSIPTMLTAEALKRYVTVALSGDGGDELFLGYPGYLHFTLPGPATRAVAGVLHAVLPKTMRGQGALERQSSEPTYWLGMLSSLGLPKHLRQEVKEHLGGRSNFSFADVLTEDFAKWPSATPAERYRMVHLKYSLPDRMFVKVDRASMAYGLEIRCPLADYRLLEFLSHLSYEDLLRGGLKAIQKRVMAGTFERSFLERPKAGFGVPLDQIGAFSRDMPLPLLNGHLRVISEGSRRALLDGVHNPRPYRRKMSTQVSHLNTLQRWLENNGSSKLPAETCTVASSFKTL